MRYPAGVREDLRWVDAALAVVRRQKSAVWVWQYLSQSSQQVLHSKGVFMYIFAKRFENIPMLSFLEVV